MKCLDIDIKIKLQRLNFVETSKETPQQQQALDK